MSVAVQKSPSTIDLPSGSVALKVATGTRAVLCVFSPVPRPTNSGISSTLPTLIVTVMVELVPNESVSRYRYCVGVFRLFVQLTALAVCTPSARVSHDAE